MSKQISLPYRFLFFAKHGLINKVITTLFFYVLSKLMLPDMETPQSAAYYYGMLLNVGLLLIYVGFFSLISGRMTIYNRSGWLLYFFIPSLLLWVFEVTEFLFGVSDFLVAKYAGNFMLTVAYLLVMNIIHRKQQRHITSEDDALINSINIKTDS